MSTKDVIDIALGTEKAEIVLKNADLVNVCSGEIYETDIAIARGLIVGLGNYNGRKEIDATDEYAVPGLIDGHTHIEMSMLSVREFAKAVVPRGTTAVVEDPHEIANVLGLEGIKAILAEARTTPLKVCCMAPSCVPSTEPSRGLETSGASIGHKELRELLTMEGVIGLSEVMNYPGVITKEDEIWKKIEVAKAFKTTIDGHAPLLSGKALNAYVLSGVGSDHENASYGEAREKLRLGMRVMVREGSAAQNLHAIAPLLNSVDTRNCMLVTDGDRSLRDLKEEGYLDHVVRRAVEEGLDPVQAVQLCTINPAQWFKLDHWIGSISPGKCADIVLLRNLERFDVNSVLVNGATDWAHRTAYTPEHTYPQFGSSVRITRIQPEDFAIPLKGTKRARIIGLRAGELLTEEIIEELNGIDTARDILKIAVVERHHYSGNIGVGFVKGFGLKHGAVASSIAHDSHNIVVIGTTEADMAFACNRLKAIGGGIVLCSEEKVMNELALPIAGLMSDKGLNEVAEKQRALEEQIAAMGCELPAPFITLSFLALPVVPKLKITDKGLVDVEKQEIVPIFCE
ncbi:MAG: adenine deaminase [Methanophagales archaeon ANME-1-THS]|nr:MAG: adenine deaminase [Methanophagales archaeon ANME-1-THS]